MTHDIVSRFRAYDFTQVGDSAGKDILRSCIGNNRICYILSDDDVRDLLLPVFTTYHHLLNDDEYAAFVDSANLPNERVDSKGNVQLSRCEKSIYGKFTQDLIAHIQYREFGSDIVTDTGEIARGLSDLVTLQTIDERSVSWQDVSNVLIRGGVKSSSSPANHKTLNDFVSLLEQSSEAKANAIVGALRFRLEGIEEDFPF